MAQKSAAAIRALQLMKQFAESRLATGRFHSAVMSKVKIVDGSEGHLKCEIPVSKELLNGVGFLHGGAIASIVDDVSTWAVVSLTDNVPGVSIDLSVSYIKAAAEGDTLVAEARTSHVGKRLAFLTVDITNKETGALLAQGRHTKYMGQRNVQKKGEEMKSKAS